MEWVDEEVSRLLEKHRGKYGYELVIYEKVLANMSRLDKVLHFRRYRLIMARAETLRKVIKALDLLENDVKKLAKVLVETERMIQRIES